jgi:hypothetical protein
LYCPEVSTGETPELGQHIQLKDVENQKLTANRKYGLM